MCVTTSELREANRQRASANLLCVDVVVDRQQKAHVKLAALQLRLDPISRANFPFPLV